METPWHDMRTPAEVSGDGMRFTITSSVAVQECTLGEIRHELSVMSSVVDAMAPGEAFTIRRIDGIDPSDPGVRAALEARDFSVPTARDDAVRTDWQPRAVTDHLGFLR